MCLKKNPQGTWLVQVYQMSCSNFCFQSSVALQVVDFVSMKVNSTGMRQDLKPVAL